MVLERIVSGRYLCDGLKFGRAESLNQVAPVDDVGVREENSSSTDPCANDRSHRGTPWHRFAQVSFTLLQPISL